MVIAMTRFWIVTLYTLAAITAACFASWLWVTRRTRKRLDDLRIPRGNFGLPFIGETYQYLVGHTTNDPDAFVRARKNKHGKIFTTHLLGSPAICSVDPDFNRFVLQNEGSLFESKYPKCVKKLLGDACILNAAVDMHRKLKPKAVAFMQLGKLKDPNRLKNIEQNILKVLSTWKPNQTIILAEEIGLINFNITAQMLFSRTSYEAKSTCGVDLVAECISLVGGILSIPRIDFPGTRYGRALKARQRIHQYIAGLIEERLGDPAGHMYNDFLSTLLVENEEHASESGAGHLSNVQIIEFVVSILIAGFEIPSSAAIMAIKYITDSPEALRELKHEHIRIQQQKSKAGEELTWNDYSSMRFTHQVFYESVRLSSVVHALHRKSLTDVAYEGILVPKDWTVVLYTRGVHLADEYFKDPFRFNPWRWQDKTINEVSFQGFGGGSRLCPGTEVGKLETTFLLYHLVTKFRWEAVEADRPTYLPVTHMLKGFPVKVTPI